MWGCADHDACNGRLFADGHYGYVTTLEFPYTIGCWGPAEDMQYPTNEKTCSPNSCPGVAKDVYFYDDSASGSASLVASLSVLSVLYLAL